MFERKIKRIENQLFPLRKEQQERITQFGNFVLEYMIDQIDPGTVGE